MIGSRVFSALIFLCACVALPGRAQISKGQQIVLNRGLQLQGMTITGDDFHLSTYSNADFTSINWMNQSTPSSMGAPPGYAWSRWVTSETNMPGAPDVPDETPYLPQLVSLQLGDEWNLNDDSVRARAVTWFNSVRTNWPNTILYGNNWGGQVQPGPLGDFITNAHLRQLYLVGIAQERPLPGRLWADQQGRRGQQRPAGRCHPRLVPPPGRELRRPQL